MIANYHTHTWRCNHASGTETEYVENAIKRGLRILGFSDHTPYPFPPTYRSRFRMTLEQFPDYCRTVEALKKVYSDRIQIHLGLEAEFYPVYFSELLAFLKDSQIEYLLLGQHFVGSEIGEHYCGVPTADITLLKRYCHQTADAMQTGVFSHLAHPDLFYFTGEEAAYREHMRLLCREAKQCRIPLEINLLGIQADRNYPNPVFWELAAEEDCDVILGCDTHAAEHLLDPASEEKAMALVERLRLNLLETLPLKSL